MGNLTQTIFNNEKGDLLLTLPQIEVSLEESINRIVENLLALKKFIVPVLDIRGTLGYEIKGHGIFPFPRVAQALVTLIATRPVILLTGEIPQSATLFVERLQSETKATFDGLNIAASAGAFFTKVQNGKLSWENFLPGFHENEVVQVKNLIDEFFKKEEFLPSIRFGFDSKIDPIIERHEIAISDLKTFTYLRYHPGGLVPTSEKSEFEARFRKQIVTCARLLERELQLNGASYASCVASGRTGIYIGTLTKGKALPRLAKKLALSNVAFVCVGDEFGDAGGDESLLSWGGYSIQVGPRVRERSKLFNLHGKAEYTVPKLLDAFKL